MIDPPPFEALALSLHHSPGVQAILVGSGLSRAAGIPTGWEITVDLIKQLAALDHVKEHDDWPKWYREKYDKEPNYSEIIAKMASTSVERRAVLHRYIDAPESEDVRKPTKAHHAIARLVASGAVRVVITTNFDRLIENALWLAHSWMVGRVGHGVAICHPSRSFAPISILLGRPWEC